ncbi:T9SS sorting signal type C domain-containing protein [Flavobacterium pectinovorum]|uniref:Glycine-rich domain-containing protein n=1 Tax=Flavobacterium pectinovorum TaxID=29533 RepID=A0A502F7G7_9FLAO|nr:T9SS sorting signal type C domain-containing protein [Flavobacterium pectinovorum]TPG45317.1 hypothetical protein EAH81_01575 [Flavobacterium pectinovorum]
MKLKLSMLFVFFVAFSWSQSTTTFTGNGTFVVPAGITSISVQAWGGGGSGGGASGAGLLFGRGAAGGGGGAYASKVLTVTPGETLNVIVAGTTSGTTANGSAGSSSTIAGYQSSILAAGGSGGAANDAGGNPVGGIGGTVAASAGTTKIAGANGGNGCSWSLLSLLLSSGAGGSGANSGGAGGAAVASLLLGTAPGNPGAAPGGAGSGAINSALGTAQVGGAGGAGKVIISYTCPTFTLSSISSLNICSSSGSTSPVTVTSPALPVGNYIVTYDRTSPSATGLTANLSVTTYGTGTFTATGLTTVGPSTITITKITAGTCVSNITAINSTNIFIAPATVGGTVSGGTTINYGSTSGLLTLSGHTGFVVKWQSAISPFTNWTDIANTATTYTSGPLTATTQFRAVVQSASTCGVENSTPTTVTVTPLPTIALATTAVSLCLRPSQINTAHSTALSYTATTGSPVSYSIVWNPTPTNSLVAVTDAPLPASPISIAIPAGTAFGTYTGTLTVKNAGGGVSSPGSVFTVTIGETPSIVQPFNSQVNAVYTSTSAQSTLIRYSSTTGSPTSFYIDWDATANAASLADQSSTPFAFTSTPGANTFPIQISANAQAGVFNGTMYLVNNLCTYSFAISVKISPLPTITLSATAENICVPSGFFSGELSSSISYTATTGSPETYSIVWNSTPTPDGLIAVTDAPLPASPIIIDVNTSELSLGTYTGTLTVKNADGVSSVGSVFTLVVGQKPSIVQPFSSQVDPVYTSTSAQTTPIRYVSTTGSPTSFYIDWDATANAASLADQGSTAYAFSSTSGSNTFPIDISANAQAGLFNGTMYLANEFCTYSFPISVKISPSPARVQQSATNQNVVLADNATNKTDNISIIAVNRAINVDSFDQKMSKVYVYDLSGNLVYRKDSVGNSKLTIDNLKSNQILVVKVVLDNNHTQTKKVLY